MNRFAILAVSLAAGLAGCNTVSGFGNDLQVLGGAMSSAASDVQSGQTGGAEAGQAQAEACAPDAHGRVQSAECGPPPLNAPPASTEPK
jgi:predicted small secreted protein